MCPIGTTAKCIYIGGHKPGFDYECYWCWEDSKKNEAIQAIMLILGDLTESTIDEIRCQDIATRAVNEALIDIEQKWLPWII